MNCAMYRSVLIELARGGRIDPPTAVHVDECERCRQFLVEQRRLTAVVRNVATSAVLSKLPARLELELLAEFDAVRRVEKRPRAFWITAGAFALAAVAFAAVIILRIHGSGPKPLKQVASAPSAPVLAEKPMVARARPVTVPPRRPLRMRPVVRPKTEETPEAAFVSIPYTMPLAPNERADIVRMDVPVAALIAAGYPMRVQDVGASASADVLVGEDGRARAVRLVSVVDSNSYRSFK